MPSLLHETWFPPVAVAAVALVGLSGRPLATSAMLMSIAPLATLGGAWIVGRVRPRVFSVHLRHGRPDRAKAGMGRNFRLVERI